MIRRIACLLFPLAGCTGSVGDPMTAAPEGASGAGGRGAPMQLPEKVGGTVTPPAPSDWRPDLPAGDPLATSPLPLRLLTRWEYENTLRDLLGDAAAAASAFPAESADETGFAKVQKIDDVNVGAYLDAADKVAARATVDLKGLLGCAPDGAAEEGCVRSFISAFGRRAYRRPLATAEVAEHLTFYKEKLRTALALPPAEAVQALVAAMLQSPLFLYRWEQGWKAGAREGEVVRLNGHHMASQLSYLLWTSMPDAELFAAAERDELTTPQQLEAQARRMLKDRRAERTLASFHEQWLGTTAIAGALRNRGLYPKWNSALAEAMSAELRHYVSDVILRRDGKLETLLTSTSSFANATLAPVYGLAGITGPAFQPVNFPERQRAGLFTLAAVMAAHADENEPSPILRGKFVREHVMCAPIPPPPDMIPDLPPPKDDVPKRERFAMHSAGSCKGCHDLMDPLGFAFENYDAIGAYRTMDGKLPVDTKGIATALDGKDQAFTTGTDLVKLLSTSEQVRACVVRQWFRYGFARKEVKADDHSLNAAYTAFRAAGYDVRELLVALVKSRSFMYRAVTADEEVAR